MVHRHTEGSGGTPGRGRKWLAGLVTMLVVGAAASTATPAQAASLPGGLGPCLGAACPEQFPPVNNGPIAGRDENISIFVGNDFRVRGGSAEAEGKVVVGGDFDQAKTVGSDVYNIGLVGVGSRVAPPDGSDWLTTGADITIAPGQRLLAEGGVVRHAGTVSGTVVADRVVRDPDAMAPYADLRDQLTAASQCYAYVSGEPRPATGSAVNNGGTTIFTGDETSALQVFDVDFDLVPPTAGSQGIVFRNIPDDATVLVNVYGAARTIRTYSGSLTDDDPWNQLREHLLWNFPDATTVSLEGYGQFQGSMLVGNRASTTTVTMPGTNGRFYSAGSLTHGAPGISGGQELHAYPFDGELPSCSGTESSTVSVHKTDAVTDDSLPGATFELWRETNGVEGLQTTGTNPDTQVGGPCVTDADGLCTRTVEPGIYYWLETAAPDGSVLPEPGITGPLVVSGDGTPVSVTVEDQRVNSEPSEITVRKTDADTGDPLPGATFELWRETNGIDGLQTDGPNPDTQVGGPCVTGTDGTCTRTVEAGTYYWLEIAEPDDHVLPETSVTDPQVVPGDGSSVSVTVTDQRDQSSDVSVIKQDAVTQQSLAGATFELWRETNGTEGLQTTGPDPDTRVGDACVTGANGTCTRTVEPGTYYWLETAAPDGYESSVPPVVGPLVVTGDGSSVVVSVDNMRLSADPESGDVNVRKTDERTGELLAGAAFELWRETNGTAGLQDSDTLVGTCVTDAEGTCSFPDLPVGTYHLVETAAPDGYRLPANPVRTFTLTANGTTITVEDLPYPDGGDGDGDHGDGDHGDHGDGDHGDHGDGGHGDGGHHGDGDDHGDGGHHGDDGEYGEGGHHGNKGDDGAYGDQDDDYAKGDEGAHGDKADYGDKGEESHASHKNDKSDWNNKSDDGHQGGGRRGESGAHSA